MLSSILISITSALLTLLMLETGTRMYFKEFSCGNFLYRDLDLFHSAYPTEHDPELGWVPRPGFQSSANIWNTSVTLNEDGIRSNGAPASEKPAPNPRVLAVGDSFTFGDQVSDSESWPAHLERELQAPVLNAGVFGYGLDQIVLRAERLFPKYRPDHLVVSFIWEDVARCELKRRTNVEKPYFVIEDGRLALQGVPTAPADSNRRRFALVRRILGHSLAAHLLMKQVAPRYWLEGTDLFEQSESSGSNGMQIGCLLMKRLASEPFIPKAQIIILGQYTPKMTRDELATMAEILACARSAGLRVLDLGEPLAKMKSENESQFRSSFRGHMTSMGNALVAQELARYIRRLDDRVH